MAERKKKERGSEGMEEKKKKEEEEEEEEEKKKKEMIVKYRAGFRMAQLKSITSCVRTSTYLRTIIRT